MNHPYTFIVNWKMYLSPDEVSTLIGALVQERQAFVGVDTILAVPLYCQPGKNMHGFMMAAQDVFWEQRGAYTGEVSPEFLKQIGYSSAIIGHSERRRLFDSEAMVSKKMRAVLNAHMIPILCVGEDLKQRDAGATAEVISQQVKKALRKVDSGMLPQKMYVAYEPIWAIGTGNNCPPQEANAALRKIRESMVEIYGEHEIEGRVRLLYGGSVDEGNIAEYMGLDHIHGFLVGKASCTLNGIRSMIQSLKSSSI